MAKAVFTTRGNLKVGVGKLAAGSTGKRSSVKTAVHDGDTITTDPDGNLGVRFLAIDTPEVSLPLPTGAPDRFVKIGSPEWTAFLADPFAAELPAFDPPLDRGLEAYIAGRVGPGAAANHATHALAAERALEAEVARDLTDLFGGDLEAFRFFYAFAHEVMDGYGRLLGYIHPDQPGTPKAQRRASYNRRQLDEGLAGPYFIWPNLDPYRPQGSLVKAVPPPGEVAPRHATAAQRGELDRARAAVRTAREQHKGIYDAGSPLALQPSELRFLSRRKPPERWVIDLGAGDDLLVPPQRYYTIENLEDRLYVPDEYIPLFEQAGWKRGPV